MQGRKIVAAAGLSCWQPKQAAGESGEICAIGQRAYRRIGHEVSAAGGAQDQDNAGRPHNARHSGSSRDVFLQYRGPPQVQRRGRWLVDTSVLMYAKARFYARALGALPDSLKTEGAELLEGPGPRSEALLA